jgi:hypothetical protein
MLETLVLPFIKSLPVWLYHIVEVMIVAIIFSFAVIFLWGMWVGIRIVGSRSERISEISVFPPSIKFKDGHPKAPD